PSWHPYPVAPRARWERLVHAAMFARRTHRPVTAGSLLELSKTPSARVKAEKLTGRGELPFDRDAAGRYMNGRWIAGGAKGLEGGSSLRGPLVGANGGPRRLDPPYTAVSPSPARSRYLFGRRRGWRASGWRSRAVGT